MAGSHVIEARVKHFLSNRHLWTHVTFHSVQEVQSLIEALEVLAKQSHQDCSAHMHLQDHGLQHKSRPSSGEIVFEFCSKEASASCEREQWATAVDCAVTAAASKDLPLPQILSTDQK